MPPTVTTVIPTYRRPALLRRAIESVLAQSYPHVVCSVLDNCSGDETGDVVREIAERDPRVRYRCHEKNLGPNGNFQAGMDAVDTPWFSFLSDDDVLLPGFYEHAMATLAEHPRARYFCGQTLSWEPSSGEYLIAPTRGWEAGFYEAGERIDCTIRHQFTWTSVVWHETVRPVAGPLLDQLIGDLPFQARAGAAFPFVVSMIPVAVFTRHPEGSSHRILAATFEEEFERCKRWCVATPGIDEATRRGIEFGFEDLLVRGLGRTFRMAFRDEDWPEFESAATLLERHGRLRGRDAIFARVGRMREASPALYRLGRRLLLAGHSRRGGRAQIPSVPDLEALVARYGAVRPD